MLGGVKCTNTWKLCKLLAFLVLDSLSWIPGNGKNINLWSNSICGMPPLENQGHLLDLKEWLCTQSIHTLYDMVVYEQATSNWKNWKRISPPSNLSHIFEYFLPLLKGKAPTNLRDLDQTKWGRKTQYY